VDLDDAFMFWALATGRLAGPGVALQFETADTETLNRWASMGGAFADVVAVSIAHVPAIADAYVLLPHGGSVGRGYGPVVVARSVRAAGDLAGARVGIPGEHTTAALLCSQALPHAARVVVPFSATLEAIDSGMVDAAVLIHEGRLVYERFGFHKVLDLGVWWHEKTGLPLPLGGNVIRRSLGNHRIIEISRLLRASIEYALAHREQALDDLLSVRPHLARHDADAYLALYANADTLDYGPAGRRAVETLLGHAPEWAP